MDEIECPYCGCWNDTKHMCLWELHDGETSEEECANCGKTFEVVAHATIEYSTHKMDEDQE